MCEQHTEPNSLYTQIAKPKKKKQIRTLAPSLLSNSFTHPYPLLALFLPQEAAGGAQAGEGAQEASHQETPERLHALHEGDEGEGHRRVHVKGKRRHQPDSGAEGEQCTHAHTHKYTLTQLNETNPVSRSVCNFTHEEHERAVVM